MGEKAIVRQGDSTTHGGTVLEGFMDNICMGKPIAGVGHKVQCPQCKGTFPIVAGAQIFQVMGKVIAVDGMETACGAKLIATQQTDFVGAGSPTRSSSGSSSAAAVVGAAATVAALAAPLKQIADAIEEEFDERFLLKDGNGNPLPKTFYTAKLPSGELVHGETDSKGNTQRFQTDGKQQIEIFIGHLEKV